MLDTKGLHPVGWVGTLHFVRVTVLFLYLPMVTELCPPKILPAVDLHLACRTGCKDSFQKGVVLGCADIAELSTYGVAEVPKIPL
jgi:hypothetical protein